MVNLIYHFYQRKISNDFVFIFDFYARPINSKKLIGEVHIRLQVVNEDLTNEKSIKIFLFNEIKINY